MLLCGNQKVNLLISCSNFCFLLLEIDLPPSRLIHLSFSYVQGMNVIAAPFLYVMPELDAFYTFSSFIQHACPLYVQPALEGVHCGVKVDLIILIHNPSETCTAAR